MKEPFSMVPEAVIYDQRLGDKAVRVYACLLRHGDNPSNCFPSHRRIADMIGCSPRSIQRVLNELERAGWIRRIARFRDGGRTSSGFEVRKQVPAAAGESPVVSGAGTPPNIVADLVKIMAGVDASRRVAWAKYYEAIEQATA